MSFAFERRIHQQMESSLQELDESAYWLELLVEGDIVEQKKLGDLQTESEELISIFVSSVKTAKNSRR